MRPSRAAISACSRGAAEAGHVQNPGVVAKVLEIGQERHGRQLAGPTDLFPAEKLIQSLVRLQIIEKCEPACRVDRRYKVTIEFGLH
jgi:hypothetical protein